MLTANIVDPRLCEYSHCLICPPNLAYWRWLVRSNPLVWVTA